MYVKTHIHTYSCTVYICVSNCICVYTHIGVSRQNTPIAMDMQVESSVAEVFFIFLFMHGVVDIYVYI
jgi:hypothetical protein